ncbi:cellulose biosynthesis cyclic di-GMP-binding regulatory protein BcsB [Acidithiobacillus sp. IBUN Pt1247-S3]|uniref:cellulose biosynthesis cyclic di-GMP-binding regulatory protein BcsB n=1 Tax=Acidithiobacillus sp. IBUN Pt1247-S3 TaxID=3166642 RepID=UPI0034E43AF2
MRFCSYIPLAQGILRMLGRMILLLAAMSVSAGVNAATVDHSVANLLHGPQYVHLSPHDSHFDIPWVIPAHQKAEQVLLHLFYFVGPGTVPGSELVVALDGRDVAAVKEDPKYPEGQAVIRLTNQPIDAGSHKISIRLETTETVASASPVWTQVDLYRSSLSYTVDHLPWRQVDFADLDKVLRQSDQSEPRILPLQLLGPVSATLLSAAQQVVAGVSLRGSEPLLVQANFGVAGDKAGDTDSQSSTVPISVVIGTEKDIGNSYSDIGKTEGPELILRQPKDGANGVQLIVTGRTPAEVLQAALAFGSNRNAVPAGAVWQVPKHLPLASDMRQGDQLAAVLRPGTEVPINKVNLDTNSAEELAANLIHFSFWMPGGQFADRQAQMTMKLNLDVAPSGTTQNPPLVTIRANGEWISQWHLGLGAGHYETKVPFSTLDAGTNHISLEVTGGTTKLLPGSTLHIPKTHDYAMLPDLRLFARTGYPLVRTDGEKLGVAYLDPSAQEVSAGLTLFARLAQASRSNLPAASAQIGDSLSGSNEIVLGTLPDLSKSQLVGAPLQLTRTGLRWQLGSSTSSWSGVEGQQPSAFLLESPNDPHGRTWKVLFAARDAAHFATAAWQLVNTKSWHTLSGNFAWLDKGGEYRSTLFGGQKIYGKKDSPWYWIYLFSVQPYWWILIALLLVAGGALSGWAIIKNRRRRWRMEESHGQ